MNLSRCRNLVFFASRNLAAVSVQLALEDFGAVVPREGCEHRSAVDLGRRQTRAELVPEVQSEHVLVVQGPVDRF